MRLEWGDLTDQERAANGVMLIFLEGRLQKRETVQWALSLDPNDKLSKLTLIELLGRDQGTKVKEPWRTAWRLLEEFWIRGANTELRDFDAYLVKGRLKAGEKTGALVATLIDLFRPYLKIKAFPPYHDKSTDPPKRIRSVDDLFDVELTSRQVLDPQEIGIDQITDSVFANSIVAGLEGAINAALEIAQRMGWTDEYAHWRVGSLNRVYFVPIANRHDGDSEPDEFHKGVAPSVKLLHAATVRLLEIDQDAALSHCRKWKDSAAHIYQRLWAAMAKDARVASADEVTEFLRDCSERQFWALNRFPELAELRAHRFKDLSKFGQESVCDRILRLPPRSLWPKSSEFLVIDALRKDRAFQEFSQIEAAGGTLSERAKTWMSEVKAKGGLTVDDVSLDHGFLRSPRAIWIKPKPDERFSFLKGQDRLRKLEIALKSRRIRFEDDPAESARAWIRQEENSDHLISDLESITNQKQSFPAVWEAFGWSHDPKKYVAARSETDAIRVIRLILALPSDTIASAIDGIANWVSVWGRVIAPFPESVELWKKLWPLAESATNLRVNDVVEKDEVEDKVYTSDEYKQVDTLNSPVGKLINMFLETCPNLNDDPHPFQKDGFLRLMRDTATTAVGKSKLTSVSRMIEYLDYFLKADPVWTTSHLLEPLKSESVDSIELWRSIGRRTRFETVLRHIGNVMSERAVDRRLGRDTQNSLSTSLIVEMLHSYLEQRAPVIAGERVQQTLRTLDDEIRAHTAGVLTRFAMEMSSSKSLGAVDVESIFDLAIQPFLIEIWPQEQSLSTPSVSKAFSRLPAAMGQRFVLAVELVNRFLVPFDCWSMHDFGLYGEVDGKPKLTSIDSRPKAAALVKLLDSCIASSEGAVIPHDLAEAIAQVKKVAPELSKNMALRRLTTLSRRV